MSARQVDTFIYGLFMDVDLLRQSGAEPANPRRAYVAETPEPHERNSAYALRLKGVLTKLGFPENYVSSVS